VRPKEYGFNLLAAGIRLEFSKIKFPFTDKFMFWNYQYGMRLFGDMQSITELNQMISKPSDPLCNVKIVPSSIERFHESDFNNKRRMK